MTKMRVAAAQTAPVWGDPGRTADKVADWIGKAAVEHVDLVAFGETFLCGYPFWLTLTDGARFESALQKDAYGFYLDTAVTVDGPEVTSVVEAVRDHGVFTYLGISERTHGGGTVYATLLAIDPVAGVVSAHRKLMPTYEERLVWGIGDGHGLRVHDTGKARVSGLNCWENWMPLARHTLYAQGVDLHVAAWPGSVGLTKDITRFIAKEGRCFVLSAGAILTDTDIPTSFPLRSSAFPDGGPVQLADGGSAIAGPDGGWVVEPVSSTEGLVIADIDLSEVRRERQNFDAAGHYFRPDVFDVMVDRSRRVAATFDET